ncbi:Plant protein 1589 of unknown function [Arabidopsis thaliana]|uniref:Uncharacterized protein n=1 Tax=Arabidopsis thaliana TaxID=3702 RepID=F4I3C5_ARATH|nr:Plant protein 1589 of unknown function [Arabidopsis thaliana]AEE32461.1 Plant protein 1589 of unknown function [Arabidopsis thaliana]|eukprot:NP_001154413.2 Plant protein 1589 of unknown function [Arabidopsis thaliana]
MSRYQYILRTIDYVKEKIERRCIQKYMSLEETMTYMYDHDHIPKHITATIWEHLQRENPNFFKEYNKRCELVRQIVTLNDLLAQQIDLMQRLSQLDVGTTAPVTKLQEPNDHHHDEVQTLEQWLETNGFANIEDTFLCLSDLVDAPEVQKPKDKDQSCDQWINGSNDLASIEETVSSLINPSPFAETPQSEPPGLRYDTDCACITATSNLVTWVYDPSGDNKVMVHWVGSQWAGFGANISLERRRPREAGFTEQRPPSVLDGGRITGPLSSEPTMTH